MFEGVHIIVASLQFYELGMRKKVVLLLEMGLNFH